MNTQLSKTTMPNYRTKKFCIYINEFYSKTENDILQFIEKLDLNDCYYDDTRLENNIREKNYGIWDGFRRHVPYRLSYIKKDIDYLANNYKEVKEKIGIRQLGNDNKWLYSELNKINEEMNIYKNQLSSVL
jgi:hypothetical protein